MIDLTLLILCLTDFVELCYEIYTLKCLENTVFDLVCISKAISHHFHKAVSHNIPFFSAKEQSWVNENI